MLRVIDDRRDRAGLYTWSGWLPPFTCVAPSKTDAKFTGRTATLGQVVAVIKRWDAPSDDPLSHEFGMYPDPKRGAIKALATITATGWSEEEVEYVIRKRLGPSYYRECLLAAYDEMRRLAHGRD